MGVLGCCVLVILIELGVARQERWLRLPVHNQWKVQSDASTREATRAEVLCLGDSLVAQGVIPAIVEKQLGLKTYNLGVGGGQPSTSYVFFKRVLEAGGRPRALVIDAMPVQFSIKQNDRVTLWSYVLTPSEAIEFARMARDVDFATRHFLALASPSYRFRFEIRSYFTSWKKVDPASANPVWNEAGSRNIQLNQGALVLPNATRFEVDPRHRDWIYPRAIKSNLLNLGAMDRLLELARIHEIPVFWVLTPVCSEIQEHGERTRNERIHEQFLQRFLKRYPNITVIDGRHSLYPSSVMNDSIHLSTEGAAVFSEDLANAVATRLDEGQARERWVQLPKYQSRTVEFEHEDLAHSHKAILDENSVIRR